MGLFALVACSEDVYQEADKMSETGAVVENGSGGIQAFGSSSAISYQSPYDQNPNYQIPFHFVIQAPVDRLEITPYLGPKESGVQESMVLAAGMNGPCLTFPNCYPHLLEYLPYVSSFGTLFPLSLAQGYTIIQDCNAGNPVFPNPACTGVPQLFNYDYNNTYNNSIPANEFTVLAEETKIYYIHYRFILFGKVHEGYLRHQLGNDSMRLSDYVNTGEWEEYSPFPQLNNMGNYGAVVVKNISDGSNELALAQKDDATDILNSEITVTDPATNISYTLRFRNEANRIVIEFIP